MNRGGWGLEMRGLICGGELRREEEEEEGEG